MIPRTLTVEEYEQGAWVADITSLDAYDGTFELDGATWVGAKVASRVQSEITYARMVGGKGNLGKTVLDKYYDGSVTLQVAVMDVCSEGGETFGSAPAGMTLTTYQRQRGTVADALDHLAEAFGLIWWIDRAGAVQFAVARTGGKADGMLTKSETDASIRLVEPSGVALGGSYDETLTQIRHVRWTKTQETFAAQLYGVPFLFVWPSEDKYSRIYSAGVDKQNGDGSIDVIADGRFGVTGVRLLSGVPGSKLTVQPGEAVLFGFAGGNPQAPFAVAFGQDTSATKQVARNTDPVKVTLDATAIATLAPFISAPPGGGGGPCTGLPGSVDVMGTIQGGSGRVSLGD